MLVERRRRLRHKVHSPAYASIGAGVGGVVLDANDSGAAIESVARLLPQSFVDLRLDLLDTRASAVTPARVAWCDANGRVGLEFLNLTGESRRQLQQWLLLNALLATEDAGRLKQAAVAPAGAAPAADGDPAFREVAERALACTEAHGAALALVDGEAIMCRATAGEIAPPPGTRLDTQSGISGACIRSGRWLRCDDPRLDPHVDRESCQALGINSVLAVPIGERDQLLGLIEVFSRSPYAFKEVHCSALQELAKTVAQSLRPQSVKAAPPAPVTEPEAKEPLIEPESKEAPAPPASTNAGAAPIPAKPTLPSPSPSPPAVPASGTAPKAGEAAGSGGERVILVALLAALVILGLWFVLGRGAGATKDVDAAEAPPASAPAPSQPTQAAPASSGLTPAAVTPELSDSVQRLRRQAEAGDTEAAFELGARYASGEDVPQNYTEAVKWFTRAANGGQVLAAATLGAYYWAGRGVAQDDVSAYVWSAIAKEGGDEASKYRLAILRSRMTAAQISEADQRAAAWRQSHLHQRSAAKITSQP